MIQREEGRYIYKYKGIKPENYDVRTEEKEKKEE